MEDPSLVSEYYSFQFVTSIASLVLDSSTYSSSLFSLLLSPVHHRYFPWLDSLYENNLHSKEDPIVPIRQPHLLYIIIITLFTHQVLLNILMTLTHSNSHLLKSNWCLCRMPIIRVPLTLNGFIHLGELLAHLFMD